MKTVKLQHKILVNNMLIFVIPCLILSLSIIALINREANYRKNQANMLILNQINSNVENYLYNAISYSNTIIGNLQLNKLVSKEKYTNEYERLKEKKEVLEYLNENRWTYIGDTYSLEILGENGNNYSTREYSGESVVSFPNLKKLSTESWYVEMLQKNKVYYLPSYESEAFKNIDTENAFRIVRPVRNFNSGRNIGITYINVSKEKLNRLLKLGFEDRKQNILFMDKSGELIGENRNFELGEISNEDILKKTSRYDYGYYESVINSIPIQVYFVTNPSTGWNIIMYEEQRNLLSIQNKDYFYIIIVIITEFFLALFMSMYNSAYISKPVKKIKNDMKSVYGGNLSIRTELSDIEEFKDLNNQFNEMLGRIEELIAELHKKETEKRALEFQALQAQINPHFLYNTLASIRFLIDMDMEDKAGESLMALGKLLRKTFSDNRELIKVEEELENLEHYLVLMKNRYQDTFEWTIDIETETRNLKIPRITLQPLVENSILHSFSEKTDMGHINICSKVEGENLLIRISDDGVGADIEKIKQRLNETNTERPEKRTISGIGIRNVQERIKIIFGKEYGMSVEKIETGGTCVSILIPAVEYEEDGKKV